MFEVLNSYLFQHKSISIPGLGTIFLEREPANTDIGSKNFLPPIYYFRFDKYFDAPDKDFFSYLANEKNIPDYEAIKWYNEFSYDIRNRIRMEEDVAWDNVGVLKKDDGGNIVFEPVTGSTPFLKPVAANIVARKEAPHQLLVGDKEVNDEEANELIHPENRPAERQTWWIYALVLAAIACVMLVLHFSANQWRVSTFGNQEKLELGK
jgi:hypothetical protein